MAPQDRASRRRHSQTAHLAAVAFLMAAAGCSPSARPTPTPTALWDGGFLSQEPCGPPCFAGVTPGATTEQEALAVAAKSTLFGACSIQDGPNQPRSILCARVILSVDRSNGIIQHIGFSAPESATIGEVISRYGEPAYVSVGVIGINVPQTAMSLYFDAIQTSLGLEPQDGLGYTVAESTVVLGVTYGPPAATFGWKIPWHGYGQYRLSPPGLPNNSLKLTRRAGA